MSIDSNNQQFNKSVIHALKKIPGPVSVFWFRRDLRLQDNRGLFEALSSCTPVLPLFIFDTEILDPLRSKTDARVHFIHQTLQSLKTKLRQEQSDLLALVGKPEKVLEQLLRAIPVKTIYANHDYEPYATNRDDKIKTLCNNNQVGFRTFKDQVIFEKSEILTDSQTPYSIYTPYKNRWLQRLSTQQLKTCPSHEQLDRLVKIQSIPFPELMDISFEKTDIALTEPEIDTEKISAYHKYRDFPGRDATTRLGLHLRFGTVSIRKLVAIGLDLNETWLSELIWREFFMMILWNFPQVADQPYKSKYAGINWRNDPLEFRLWCKGETGYPLVDAGMRELNATGFMHNRVRMVTASFLTKHLLIDWRWGEAYFAEKLLDFELASNNGNWQWAAGCGCDAAPYFRIFNPATQMKKFDPDLKYIKKWIPEFGSKDYPSPIVDHRYARERVLAVYKAAIDG